MRRLALAIVLGAGMLQGGEIVVQRVQGEVHVRQGVTETWQAVATGDVLKPDDTMRTGPRGSAVILLPGTSAQAASRRITLPPDVMVDLGDVRDLSQEDLMLMLAMEKVRSSSYRPADDGLKIPNASVVHGTDKAVTGAPAENAIAVGILQLNGTRVLFENGFYPTCALKALEVFRLFPPLAERFDSRLLVAEALERAHLRGEALSEYGAILNIAGLTQAQASLVRARMEQMKK